MVMVPVLAIDAVASPESALANWRIALSANAVADA